MNKILILLVFFISLYAKWDFDIDSLRKKQEIELEENFKKFQEKALRSKRYNNYTKKQQKKLRTRYAGERNNIINRYKKIDRYRIKELNQDIKLNGGLINTGSEPKNVNADVDIAANNKEAFEQHKKHWIEKYGKSNIIIEGYKITNIKTDTVMWKSESMLSNAERRAISKDHDAYITSGGKHSTSVSSIDIKSSKTGSGLDPLRKLTYGIKHNIIKDVGKSLVKITTSADGKDFIKHIEKGTLPKHRTSNKTQIKENKLLKQASDLKLYKDPIEAGIVDLTDPPEVARKKRQQFTKDALALSIKKQNKLDIADQRKKRIYKHMITTFPEGSTKRNELEKKLKISEKTNIIARKKVNQSLKELGSKKSLLTKATIEKTEQKIYEKREQKRDLEKQKILSKSKSRTKYKISKKRKSSRISAKGAASFLIQAYQLKQSLNNTIKDGGNNFVTISESDSQLTKNIKAYIGVSIESTTFGGAFSAGKRADEEERQRIMDAIKKGKTVNPLVSFVRASFWGLAYVVKDVTVGSLEYTKDKLVQLDKEIRTAIKDSVHRKYSTKFQEESNKLLKEKKKQTKSKNQEWDKYLAKNRATLEKGQSKILSLLDRKISKERQKAKASKISSDQFSDSFVDAEKTINKYHEDVEYIKNTKKEIARIKRETAQTQKRIDHQWDGFSEGLAIVAGALKQGAKEYQKQQSSRYKKTKSRVLEDEKDDDYDRDWNKKVVDVYSSRRSSKSFNSSSTKQNISSKNNYTLRSRYGDMEVSSYKSDRYDAKIDVCNKNLYIGHSDLESISSARYMTVLWDLVEPNSNKVIAKSCSMNPTLAWRTWQKGNKNKKSCKKKKYFTNKTNETKLYYSINITNKKTKKEISTSFEVISKEDAVHHNKGRSDKTKFRKLKLCDGKSWYKQALRYDGKYDDLKGSSYTFKSIEYKLMNTGTVKWKLICKGKF